MRIDKVIVPCGALKEPYAAPAIDLYRGSYFRASRAYALSLVPGADVLILSAKHGLVTSSQVLEPYDVRFGGAGAISQAAIAAQVLELGLREQLVLVLGGKAYTSRLRCLLDRAIYIMDEAALPRAGMGYQMQWLYRNLGRVPS